MQVSESKNQDILNEKRNELKRNHIQDDQDLIDLEQISTKNKKLQQTIKKSEPNKRYNTRKKTKRGPHGYLGIQNMSNTCYLNSLIQILYNLKHFRYFIYRINIYSRQSKELFKEEDRQFIHVIQKTFIELQFGEQLLYPIEFFNILKTGDETIYDQHDIAEFQQRLIIKLKEILQPNKELLQTFNYMFEGEEQYSRKPIGHEENQNYKIQKKNDTIYDIRLEVKECDGLIDSLEQYTSDEFIDDYNHPQIGKTTAVKSLRFKQLPNILSLHLRRTDYENNQNKKIKNKFRFEKQIDLSKFVTNPLDGNQIYDLYGVVAHQGRGIQKGHYYAFVNPNLNNNWFKFDDSKVEQVNEKIAIDDNYTGQTAAYMLVYINRAYRETINFEMEDGDIPYYLRPENIQDTIQEQITIVDETIENNKQYYQENKIEIEKINNQFNQNQNQQIKNNENQNQNTEIEKEIINQNQNNNDNSNNQEDDCQTSIKFLQQRLEQLHEISKKNDTHKILEQEKKQQDKDEEEQKQNEKNLNEINYQEQKFEFEKDIIQEQQELLEQYKNYKNNNLKQEYGLEINQQQFNQNQQNKYILRDIITNYSQSLGLENNNKPQSRLIFQDKYQNQVKQKYKEALETAETQEEKKLLQKKYQYINILSQHQLNKAMDLQNYDITKDDQSINFKMIIKKQLTDIKYFITHFCQYTQCFYKNLTFWQCDKNLKRFKDITLDFGLIITYKLIEKNQNFQDFKIKFKNHFNLQQNKENQQLQILNTISNFCKEDNILCIIPKTDINEDGKAVLPVSNQGQESFQIMEIKNNSNFENPDHSKVELQDTEQEIKNIYLNYDQEQNISKNNILMSFYILINLNEDIQIQQEQLNFQEKNDQINLRFHSFQFINRDITKIQLKKLLFNKNPRLHNQDHELWDIIIRSEQNETIIWDNNKKLSDLIPNKQQQFDLIKIIL